MMAEGAHQDHKIWTRLVIGIALAVVALKLTLAFVMPLGVDEAYAIAVAREFSWAFFDHPPLGFWSPVIAAKLFGIEHQFVYRAPFLIYGFGTTYALYLLGSALHSAQAGFWAALLFSVSPFFILSGGLFVVPDGPLFLASVVTALVLIRIVIAGSGSIGQWCWVGVALAVALASKYQAALIPVSVLGLVIFTPALRHWLRQPGPYLAGAIGLVGLLPVLIWNMGHDWASLSFHTARAGQGLNFGNFAAMGLGQMVYLAPPIMVLAIWALWAAFGRTKPKSYRLLAFVALGSILVFNLTYMMSRGTLPHWAMPGWLFALPLAGALIADFGAVGRRRVGMWVGGFGVFVGVVLLALAFQFSHGALNGLTKPRFAHWDASLEIINLDELMPALEARGLLADGDLIAAKDWIGGGLISTALDGQYPVRVIYGPAHHFAYMGASDDGGMALLLALSLSDGAEAAEAWHLSRAREIDPNAQSLMPVIIHRGTEDFAIVSVIRLQLPQP